MFQPDSDPDALHPGTGTSTDEESTTVDTSSENSIERLPFESQTEVAERVVKADGVRFVPNMKAYMVQGVRGKIYSVSLPFNRNVLSYFGRQNVYRYECEVREIG